MRRTADERPRSLVPRGARSRRGFSFVEILLASLLFLCLLLPLYFIFFSATRGVETSVRQLEAVAYATEVMSQILGIDEQAVRLYGK